MTHTIARHVAELMRSSSRQAAQAAGAAWFAGACAEHAGDVAAVVLHTARAAEFTHERQCLEHAADILEKANDLYVRHCVKDLS